MGGAVLGGLDVLVDVRLQQDAAALEAARTMQAIARSLRKD